MNGQRVWEMLLDALTIALALRILGMKLRPIRLLAAAAMGTALSVLTEKGPIPSGWLFLPIAALMMALAGGRTAVKRPVRSGLALLLAAGMLGGTVQALAGAAGSRKEGLLLALILTPVMTALVVRTRHTVQSVRTVRVICRFQGRTAAFEAMVDSGNCLRDYLTHRPVIVLPEQRGRALFRLEGMPLRPIFAETAGGKVMMDCFVPDETRVVSEKRERRVEALVALSPGLDGKAPALLPAALLEEND